MTTMKNAFNKAQKNLKDTEERIEIPVDPATFKATKKSPIKESVFLIYADAEHIFVENSERAGRASRYPLDKGTLYLVVQPNRIFSYFRSERFAKFLKDYGINRVRNIDPNGEYHFRHGKHRDNEDCWLLHTDGVIISVNQPRSPDALPVFSVRYPKRFMVVENASFAIAQQITLRDRGEDGKECTFLSRELITRTDVFTFEASDEFRDAIAKMDRMYSDMFLTADADASDTSKD